MRVCTILLLGVSPVQERRRPMSSWHSCGANGGGPVCWDGRRQSGNNKQSLLELEKLPKKRTSVAPGQRVHSFRVCVLRKGTMSGMALHKGPVAVFHVCACTGD